MEEADLLVSCPYNPAHRIRKYKFMSHVAKCKKTSKVVDKTECPLDRSHIVDHAHLKEHIASCSSLGKVVNMDVGYDKPDVKVELPVMPVYNSTENWEEEPEVPTYDPMEASSKKPVTRCVPGLTKSEKKKFRESERMRMANLKGCHSASAASASMKDMVVEVPLRPPRDVSPTRISQNDYKSTQMHDHDDDRDTSMQAKFVPEFHNDSFHRMLYNELAPEEDNINQLEQSLHNTTTKISLKDFQHINRENGNFSISDQNQETKVKKTETDAASELFNINNRKKERNECIASTSSVSDERIPDKLLTLLKTESSVKKVHPMEEKIKIDQMNKDSEKEPVWNEILSKFNERLVDLTNIQNAAAEESARILEQLKELRLREEIASRK